MVTQLENAIRYWYENRTRWLEQYRVARAQVLEQLEKELEADRPRLEWPPGAVVRLYRLSWVAGFDDNNEPLWVEFYTAKPSADPRAWFEALEWDATSRIRVESPNGYLIKELVCRRVEDLPDRFRRIHYYEAHAPNLCWEESSHWLRLIWLENHVAATVEELEMLQNRRVVAGCLWEIAPSIRRLLTNANGRVKANAVKVASR